MADTKISALSAGSAFAGTEEIPGVQSANTVKFTAAQIRNYVLATPVAVVGNSTAGAEIRLPEDTDNGSNYIALKAPDTLGANVTYTLPGSVTNGFYLQTDGSGNLTWAAGGSAAAPLTLTGGTVTDPSTPLTITQTWNDAADTFNGFDLTITNTASATGSTLFRFNRATNTYCGQNIDGTVHIGGVDSSYGAMQIKAGQNASATLFSIFSFTSNTTPIASANGRVRMDADQIMLGNAAGFVWTSNATVSGATTRDTSLYRVAAGVVGPRGTGPTAGAAFGLIEQTAPAAPATDGVYIYAEDNGSGKTRLMARFATGAAQQIAIEP